MSGPGPSRTGISRAIFFVPGSARALACTIRRLAEWTRSRRKVSGGGAGNNMRGACAPQPQKNNETIRELRQLVPLHSAHSFFAAQMRLGQQLAKIFVPGAIFDQDWQNRSVFHA